MGKKYITCLWLDHAHRSYNQKAYQRFHDGEMYRDDLAVNLGHTTEWRHIVLASCLIIAVIAVLSVLLHLGRHISPKYCSIFLLLHRHVGNWRPQSTTNVVFSESQTFTAPHGSYMIHTVKQVINAHRQLPCAIVEAIHVDAGAGFILFLYASA